MAESNIKRNISIIEQGTSGIWTYRKWSDGTSECWGIYQTTASHYYTGNGFYGYSSGTIAFPDGLFDSRPIITVDGAIGNGFYLGSIPSNVSATKMEVVAMSTSSGSASCHYEIHAFGKWR